jgi:hypothetical protein
MNDFTALELFEDLDGSFIVRSSRTGREIARFETDDSETAYLDSLFDRSDR